jgi:hypothetical protein
MNGMPSALPSVFPSVFQSVFVGVLLFWLTPAVAQELNTLEDLRRYFQNCYQPNTVTDQQEVTIRFAMRANGTLLGPPRVTYVKGAPNMVFRKVLSDAAKNAVMACLPLPLTDGLGRAIAGRTYSIRFVGRRALPLS